MKGLAIYSEAIDKENHENIKGHFFLFSFLGYLCALPAASFQENLGSCRIYWLGPELKCNFLSSHSYKDIASSCTFLAKNGIFNCFCDRFWLGVLGTRFYHCVK